MVKGFKNFLVDHAKEIQVIMSLAEQPCVTKRDTGNKLTIISPAILKNNTGVFISLLHGDLHLVNVYWGDWKINYVCVPRSRQGDYYQNKEFSWTFDRASNSKMKVQVGYNHLNQLVVSELEY